MTFSRWWHLAVVGTAVVLSALVALDQPPVLRLLGAVAVNVLLVAAWFALGRRAYANRALAITLSAIVILLAGAGTGFDATMATVQCICYPMIWVLLDRTRDAVIANVVLALSVGTGMFLGLGATSQALLVALTIEGLSVVFSLALGLWINSISEKSEERKQLIAQLEEAQAELAALSRDAGAVHERERLAREIHDTIAQDLTGLVLTAQRGSRELRDGNRDEAARQFEILEENARNALAETRALVASGAAVGVDTGLPIALRRLADRFTRETGIAVTVETEESFALDRDSEVVLLRCAQEALANVRKHSGAKTATVTLGRVEERIELRVVDDGHGFDASSDSTGFGLQGMRERLGLVDGVLAVSSSRFGGTQLVAALPAVTA